MSSIADDDGRPASLSGGHEDIDVLARKYTAAFSGDGARLFIQLAYFYLVANTLSISEFGLFATASATGIVLSRVAGFGFLSPLYRVATVKPHLIGTYTAGYIAALVVSLPLVALIGMIVHGAFFSGMMSLGVFALIAGTEILFWRTLEVTITVNKGLEKFGRASLLIVFGFSAKALAAVWLAYGSRGTLADWAAIYFSSQAAMAAIAITLFYPRSRLRLRFALYRRRLADALSVSGAEVLFYLQSELDKLVVLAVGGAVSAGLYSIVMRLVDLTAMPVRTFSTLLTQRLMRRPQIIDRPSTRMALEAGVFAVSTLALAAMAAVFTVKPDILGVNVQQAGTMLWLVLLVPALRNLIEYQSELLYGRGQTFVRMINYAILGGVKAGLLVGLLSMFTEPADWLIWTNAVFTVLYAISAILTYTAMRRPAIRI
jgi:O-antigen/teichoic acid export membrane protein